VSSFFKTLNYGTTILHYGKCSKWSHSARVASSVSEMDCIPAGIYHLSFIDLGL